MANSSHPKVNNPKIPVATAMHVTKSHTGKTPHPIPRIGYWKKYDHPSVYAIDLSIPE